MAAIHAGGCSPDKQIVLLDGAKKIGAKILISGGGRCNVTHETVDASAYAGASRNAIKKVLQGFDVPQTTQFFAQLGVDLKREEGGKLFPSSNKAQTVLTALLQGVRSAGVTLLQGWRVESVSKQADGRFLVRSLAGQAISAEIVVLATGGKSIPKSGSDGHGYALAQALGHSLTAAIFPALVPLTLPREHFICQLSGLTLPTTLTLWNANHKKLTDYRDSTLCTHFGLSGPSVLDMSRHWIAAQLADPQAYLTINWLPDFTSDAFEQGLLALGKRQPLTLLRDLLPERLARSLLEQASLPGQDLTREARKRLVALTTRYRLPLTGNRGYNYAEVTAGGVPLTEINLKTMASRLCPGLYLCGEICDVDGRIGGYNFQWAWASGFVAGSAIGRLAANQ